MGLISTSRDDQDRSSSRREHGAWARLMAPGEQIQELFRLPRSVLIFTGRRLLVVDEALSGRQVDYLSIPYRSISHFAVDAAGMFAAEAELRIWVVGRTSPIEKSFGPDVDVYAVQAELAQRIAC